MSRFTDGWNTCRYWTEEEHQRFLDALQTVGPKDVKAIASFVGSRSATQVRTHAQKYFLKLVSVRDPRSLYLPL
jgi:SHAQKYF class myb-like DNA-binding protein